ncbi:unnamed protein product [Adineta ricciae]|uniref:F-box domain-containing protein n=1 Tax=Adineta ricciae TaxID=249248 RepID=A0A813NNU8_ADIRI|nr:unnamed protein product [Adineta ricciae]
MVACLEDLPVELWISIFAYLEAHDLLQAFSNLNYYFDQIISSDYILFHVRLVFNQLIYTKHLTYQNFCDGIVQN